MTTSFDQARPRSRLDPSVGHRSQKAKGRRTLRAGTFDPLPDTALVPLAANWTRATGMEIAGNWLYASWNDNRLYRA